MPTVTALIRKGLLADVPDRVPSPDELRQTERSPEFERLRMNRKVLGAMRYGRLGDPDKPQYDRVADMIRRLWLYANDGNAEHLVDVANLAELEFVEGARCVQPTDDGQHTEEL
jgi:hypothetical protein